MSFKPWVIRAVQCSRSTSHFPPVIFITSWNTKGEKTTHTQVIRNLWQICWQERKQSKSTTYIKVIFLVISYFLPNLCAGAPYVSMMTVLACSRFHWQSCRSPSHSDLDLRPKRNNCSTCDPDRHTQGKFSFMLTPAVFFKLKSLKKKLPNSRK